MGARLRQPESASFRTAKASDLQDIGTLLVDAGLPTQDLTGTLLGHFMVGLVEGRIIGVIGLELFADVALVRSFAVSREHRGRGVGDGLLARIENHAGQLGIRRLYALTVTASEYLGRRGYVPVPRDQVVQPVRASTQFTSLCPTTAICLMKRLA